MKCPACFNELTQMQVGTLVVDVCHGSCGGIWFDAFELQRVDEEDEAGGEPLLHIERHPNVKVDAVRKRDCPRCPDVKLHRHFFSAKRRVEVDQCPNCGGYWLDAGELAQIRAELTDTATAAQMHPASLSGDVIRYLYRLKAERRHQQ
jgi:Zn-finger nucleic acid-binding protein